LETLKKEATWETKTRKEESFKIGLGEAGCGTYELNSAGWLFVNIIMYLSLHKSRKLINCEFFE
jgi:hypothetical protein